MSKKVLILGCSFSQGSYARDETSPIKERIVSSYGWYDRLKCLENLEIDVFGFGGGGYTTFAETLSDLHDSGTLKDYSMLIIQETWESRFVLRKKDFSWINDSSKEIKERELLIQHRSANPRPPQSVFSNNINILDSICEQHYKIPSLPTEFKFDILESITYKNLIKFSLAYINQTIEQYNLKCFVFSLFEPSANPENLPKATRLDLPLNLYYEIKNESLKNLSSDKDLPKFHLRHFSNLGNEKLGEIVNESLKKFI
jgi:hypothetical protein